MKRMCWMLALLLWSGPQALWAKGKPTPSSQAQPIGNKDVERAKKLFDEGEAFFKLGQYQEAVAAYQEAYLLSKAPLFLLNIGQCYTNLGQTKEAIHSYEAFIREDPKSPYRAEMEGKIDDLKAYLTQKQNEASASFPVLMVAPVEKTLNKKRVLVASAGGAALLGVGLTFFFIYTPPRSDGGAQPVTF